MNILEKIKTSIEKIFDNADCNLFDDKLIIKITHKSHVKQFEFKRDAYDNYISKYRDDDIFNFTRGLSVDCFDEFQQGGA